MQVGRRQQPRQPAREHRLAHAGRTDHEQVVAARGRDLERALGVVLPADVGEVRRARTRTRLPAVGDGGDGFLLSAQHARDPVQRRGADHLEVRHERRLAAVLGRDDQALVTGRPRPERSRQRPTDGPQLAAQGQLAAERASLERLGRHLAAGGEQADGDREVEARACLAHVRGREVHGDPHQRELEPRVLDGRTHALARLPYRPVGQPHERECGQAAAHVHLHGDLVAANALEGERGDAGEHASAR